MRQAVNDILSNYALPIILMCIILGAVVGLVKNWEFITDTSGTGRKKEGLINTAYIIGYVALTVAIISGILALVSKINLSI